MRFSSTLTPHRILRPIRPIPSRRCRNDMTPSLLPINKQPIVQKTLLACIGTSNLDSAEFGVSVRKISITVSKDENQASA